MDAGKLFSIGFRTFDKRKDEGGEFIEYDLAVKTKKIIGESRDEHTSSPRELRKDPKHFDNSTRNITVLPEGNIVKVHIRLICFFNAKQVM